jgi:hypothetical protein
MKKVIISSVVALAFSLALTVTVSAASYNFATYLTVGSTGADVSALQSFLVSNGYLTMPAGVSMGYFGQLTKAAVIAYQTAVGIVPQSGFVGPLTIAKLNNTAASVAMNSNTSSSNTVPSSFVCPPTWSCPTLTNTTTTTTGTVTSSVGTITTPGVQGIISVTQGPVSTSVANAGQLMVPVLDVRVQAQFSDVSVQSLQLDLGTSTTIYNFVYSKLYLVDPTTGTVLVSIPLNNGNVVQNGNNYIVSLTGFNFIVPKGTYKDLVLKADLYNQINTTYAYSTAYPIGIASQGLRAVDGAGINQYGPTGTVSTNPNGDPISQTMIIGQSLITSASANISLDGSSPLTNAVGVTNTTQGQYLGLPVMIFDVNAQGDTLHLHNVSVSITNSSGSGSVNAAYLYQGSTPIASATVGTNGIANFTNISDNQAGASIPVNTTVPFTVKVDVSGLQTVNNVTPAPAIITASTSALTIYNSIDSTVNPTGIATGNAQTVFGVGPVISLVGTPQISISSGNNNSTTTKYTATFNLQLQAVGEAVNFGLPASTTVAAFGSSTTSTNVAQLYVNSAPSLNNGGIQVIAGYSAPSNTTLDIQTGTSYFTLSQNSSVTVPVTYSWIVPSGTATTYGIQLQGFNWFTSTTGAGVQLQSFMKNQTAWRTSSL